MFVVFPVLTQRTSNFDKRMTDRFYNNHATITIHQMFPKTDKQHTGSYHKMALTLKAVK